MIHKQEEVHEIIINTCSWPGPYPSENVRLRANLGKHNWMSIIFFSKFWSWVIHIWYIFIPYPYNLSLQVWTV